MADREQEPAARIEAYLQVSMAALLELGPDFVRDVDGYRPAAALLAQHSARSQAFVEQTLQTGVDEGRLGNIDTGLAAQVLSSAISQVITPESLMARGKPWTETVRSVIELLMYGFHGRKENS